MYEIEWNILVLSMTIGDEDDYRKAKEYEKDGDLPTDIISHIVQGDVMMTGKWLRNFDKNNVAKLAGVLFIAAQCGHVELCRILVQSVHPTKYDILEMPAALASACHHGHLDCVQYLAKMIGFDKMDEMRGTLIASSTHGHDEIVAWLCQAMDLTEKEKNKWILSAACARDDVMEVSRLVFHIGSDSAETMSHALRVAAYKGCLSVVDWLLRNTAADVGSYGVVWQGDGAVTALLAACSQGHLDVANLLAHSSTPSVINLCSKKVREKEIIREDTAIHLVIWCNSKGWTILHDACSDGDIDKLIKLVYKRDIDLNAQDNEGYTPLHAACAVGNLDVVRILLSVDADLNLTTDWGHTAEQLANDNGNQRLIDFLTYRATSIDDLETATTNSKESYSHSMGQ